MQTTAQIIEDYLHAHIPLTQAMQVSVSVAMDAEVVLSAPLEPNINHRETVFGGSASALCILAAWSLIYLRLKHEGLQGRIVIQKNSMEYLRPIAGPFQAACKAPDADAWQRLYTGLQRKGAGRIVLQSQLLANGQTCGTFEGTFVTLRP